jgi:hypothetical protein
MITAQAANARMKLTVDRQRLGNQKPPVVGSPVNLGVQHAEYCYCVLLVGRPSQSEDARYAAHFSTIVERSEEIQLGKLTLCLAAELPLNHSSPSSVDTQNRPVVDT